MKSDFKRMAAAVTVSIGVLMLGGVAQAEDAVTPFGGSQALSLGEPVGAPVTDGTHATQASTNRDAATLQVACFGSVCNNGWDW